MISLDAYLALLAVVALERVAELLISRRNARRAFARGAIEVGRAHFRVMVGFHALFLISCAAEPLVFQRAVPPTLTALALLGLIAAQALRYWAIVTLGERWNTRVIVLPGAAPVTDGPYRLMRHPNYLAVVIEIASLPMLRGAWITALVFSLGNAAILAVRIPAEERALGGAYARAFASRARFIPRHG